MDEKSMFAEIEDECKISITKIVTNFLKDKIFNVMDNDMMINFLQGKIMNELKMITKNFKFVLSFALLKNESAGFCQEMALLNNPETDGCITLKFSFDKIICIVNLFCLSI